MDFDKGIKTALFLGKMGILIFSFYFLSFWVYELTGSPSSLLVIGILFSGLFLLMVVLVKGHFLSTLPYLTDNNYLAYLKIVL